LRGSVQRIRIGNRALLVMGEQLENKITRVNSNSGMFQSHDHSSKGGVDESVVPMMPRDDSVCLPKTFKPNQD